MLCAGGRHASVLWFLRVEELAKLGWLVSRLKVEVCQVVPGVQVTCGEVAELQGSMESVDPPLMVALAACGQQPMCLMELKGHRETACWFLPHVLTGCVPWLMLCQVRGPCPPGAFRQALIKESPRACKLWWLMIGASTSSGDSGKVLRSEG